MSRGNKRMAAPSGRYPRRAEFSQIQVKAVYGTTLENLETDNFPKPLQTTAASGIVGLCICC